MGQKKLTGAKFVTQELSFDLSPEKEDFAAPETKTFTGVGVQLGGEGSSSKLVLKPLEK